MVVLPYVSLRPRRVGRPGLCVMNVSLLLFLLSTCALLPFAIADAPPDHAHQQQQVHERMNDLVDSVRDAVKDADAASDKRQVVDLGQSLQLLETKFSGLRAALADELGASLNKMEGHNTATREVMDKATELVRSIVSQRNDIRTLANSLRETESAIRAIREGLHNFDKEIVRVNKLVGLVHDTHGELNRIQETTMSHVDKMANRTPKKPPVVRRWMFIVIGLEVVAVVAFLYTKRSSARPAMHKAYGKFG